MPLDSIVYQLLINDWHFYKKAVWYYKFAWLPHRCNITNRRIWLTCAYQGIAVYTGPGEPVFEKKWIGKEEFMIARLKGKI
jgi:hypothetical protein